MTNSPRHLKVYSDIKNSDIKNRPTQYSWVIWKIMRTGYCPLCRHSNPGNFHCFPHVITCCDSCFGSFNLMFSWCKISALFIPLTSKQFPPLLMEVYLWERRGWHSEAAVSLRSQISRSVVEINDKTDIAAAPHSSRLYVKDFLFFLDKISKHNIHHMRFWLGKKQGLCLKVLTWKMPEKSLTYTLLFWFVVVFFFLAHYPLTPSF